MLNVDIAVNRHSKAECVQSFRTCETLRSDESSDAYSRYRHYTVAQINEDWLTLLSVNYNV